MFVDLSNFNTSNVTDMSYMFAGCYGAYTIDVSSFDTSSVTNMRDMFADCSSVSTIFASTDFVTTNVTNSVNMFLYCDNLSGGSGTSYSTEYVDDASYARIDNPPSAPGYFTAVPSSS